jgi:hypothetical protein
VTADEEAAKATEIAAQDENDAIRVLLAGMRPGSVTHRQFIPRCNFLLCNA